MDLKKIQSCDNSDAIQNYDSNIERTFELYAFNHTFLMFCSDLFALLIDFVQFTEVLNQFDTDSGEIQKIIVFMYFHVLLNLHVSLNSAVEAFKHWQNDQTQISEDEFDDVSHYHSIVT